jgi:hypothetical protein
MNKLSSKIIISLLLAVVLWGGGMVGVNANVPTMVQNAGAQNSSTAVGNDQNSLDAQAQAETAEATPEGEDFDFFAWATNGIISLIEGPIAKTVMMVNGILLQGIVIPLTSILLRISAAIMDSAINFTLSTNIFYSTSSGIIKVWSFVRNICNITFIFILLWAAIQMIIGMANGKTKKIVADVIIAALLINFSLFITRIVIDAGNILGTTLYNNIITFYPNATGFSDVLMQSLGISSVSESFKSASGEGASVWSVSFGMISYLQFIIILIGFIVFLYTALLLAVRIVALIFLSVMSPIGFMGNVLPKLEEYSKIWRETLYNQAMIAPIFLLFIYLIVQISSSFTKMGGAIPKGTEDYNAYFRYVMVIVLMVMAVKTTKKMAGEIGKVVEKLGVWAAGAAIGVATGGAAFAARATIGRAGNALATSQKLKDASVSDNIAKRWSAKATMALGGGVSKRSFDIRNVSALSDLAKEHLGIDVKQGVFGTKFASAGKGGYAGRIKEQEKAGEEKAKTLSEGISFTKEQITEGVAKKKLEIEGKINERNALKVRKDSTTNPLNDLELAELRRLESTIKTYTSLKGDEYNDKIEGELVYAKKKERLEAAAKVEEGTTRIGKIINTSLGGAKEKAKKLRDAYKKPSKEKALAEAVKAQAKETAEETADTEEKVKPAAAAPSGGGGSTPPAAGTP